MAMFQNFLMKQMLKRQMKGVPEAEQEKVLDAIEKNPEFFQNIALEIQEKVKNGMGQMEASMEVMKAHQGELLKVMGK